MSLPRFDLDHLRGLVGDKVFARGEDYADSGRVEPFALHGGRLTARAFGTQTYVLSLAGVGRDMQARCSCPFATDYGLCKHIVALAILANELLPETAEALGARHDRIRQSLAGRDAAALIELILDVAARHPALLDEFDPEGAEFDEDDWEDDADYG